MKLTERTRHARDHALNVADFAQAQNAYGGRRGLREQWITDYTAIYPTHIAAKPARAGRYLEPRLRRIARHRRKLRRGWA